MGVSTTQSGNEVHGPMAGGDIIYNIRRRPETVLERLFSQLESEAEEDRKLREYIKELEIFTRTVANEDVIGVEAKLIDGDRADEVDMAVHMKEIVFASLKENFSSPTFQRIYANLIGKLHENFNAYAKPAIRRKASREEVDLIVHEKVLNPVLFEVEHCGAAHTITPQTLRGMIYFLTGNCHIKWRY